MTKSKSTRILLVDDSEQYRVFLKRNLLAGNFEIVGEAEDGEQGILLFKSEKPDLTLLDFEMPAKNGGEVLDEIISMNPDAVVIMLSGVEDNKIMKLCIEKGASHFIHKDSPPETIISAIEESFEKV